ncbi:hypothetical protein [Brevibacillus porteri]|uniref:hypothetical protein n=1 Tax=Brevibacillus porteri TaxID=2126350 RepID=UPI003D1F7F68
MPSVYYRQSNGTLCEIKAVERFEKFLDDSHNEIGQNLHEDLVDFHSEIDDEVQEKLSELQQRIDELEEQVKELQEELENTD